MFKPTSTLPNFTLGKLSVVRKPIVNGGAIRPGGLLLFYRCNYYSRCSCVIITVITNSIMDSHVMYWDLQAKFHKIPSSING